MDYLISIVPVLEVAALCGEKTATGKACTWEVRAKDRGMDFQGSGVEDAKEVWVLNQFNGYSKGESARPADRLTNLASLRRVSRRPSQTTWRREATRNASW